ncbi:MAG TPA: phosphoribosylformylglycinamidine synthase subunit PurQ [Thermodesulfobacteriota bacterium]
MKFGVIVFPGSNCDHDCYHVVKHVFGQPAEYIWHKSTSLDGFDCVILPGGFSYGDYLRTGAIASSSPVMSEVVSFANRGGLVIGICNGFQILTEAGLLPGVLMRNRGLKFICSHVHLKVGNTSSPFTGAYKAGQVVDIPIAHADGNYYAESETIKRLEGEGRVAFRYSTPQGVVSEDANPNGALSNIAGILSEKGNVLGMMPHPERACEGELGSLDGRGVFESIIGGMSK